MVTGLAPYAPLIVAVGIIALFAAFLAELRTPEVAAGAAVAVFLLLGILELDDVLGVLSNSAPVTIIALFVVSAALVRTGAIRSFTNVLKRHAKSRGSVVLVGFLLAATLLSAFLNNTPVVMLMIPVAVRLAAELDQSPSRLLIPLSYAAILGGTCTLIGTSTNIIVDSIARQKGMPAFHIFEIAPLGVIIAGAGLVYLLVVRRFLPDRAGVASVLGQVGSPKFLVEIVIEENYPHLGERARDVKELSNEERRIVDIVRHGVSLRRTLPEVHLQAGDIVVVRSPFAEVLTMQEAGKIGVGAQAAKAGAQAAKAGAQAAKAGAQAAKAGAQAAKVGARVGVGEQAGMIEIGSRNSAVFETLVAPKSGLIGRRIAELRMRRRYGVYPIALHRRGVNLKSRFETAPLEVGDTLLLEGAPDDVRRLADEEGLINVAEPSERAWRRDKAPIAIAVMAAIVLGAAFGLMPIAALAIIGAVAVLVFRCVEPDEAVRSVDWQLIGLLVAMLAVGRALDNSGLVETIVAAIVPWLAGANPLIALALVFVMSSLLTELVTNNAVAIIVTPVAISLAAALGVDPRGFIVAVMFGASASFMTPIGYQTNTLVYAAGGYRFADFLKVGAPMHVLVAVIAVIVIPMIWPF